MSPELRLFLSSASGVVMPLTTYLVIRGQEFASRETEARPPQGDGSVRTRPLPVRST